MSKNVSIRRSLLSSLVPIVLLLGTVLVAMSWIASQRTVRRFSASLIEQTEERTQAQLRGLFRPVERMVELLEQWSAAGLVDLDDPEAVDRALMPLLREYPWTSSAILADQSGREHMLLHSGTSWRTRQLWRDEWQGRVRVWEWTDDDPARRASEESLDYDPRTRPWFVGARESLEQGAGIHWTEPYTFFTTGEPGITASLAFRGGDGLLRVVAVDLRLVDISRFTTEIEVHRRGRVYVTTEEGLLLGLPLGSAAEAEAMLERPASLSSPLARDAAAALEIGDDDTSLPTRFRSGGENWWGQVGPFDLGGGRRLLIGVVVPEAELLGDLRLQRWLMGGVTLLVLGLAMSRAVTLARRFSQPIEALANESERIATGDLEPGTPIESSLLEVDRLAESHEHMRVGLQTLLKIEHDLQLARRIQQNTFPETLPELAGFDIDAWNDPADETGGDTYDVIGMKGASVADRILLEEGSAGEAVLLLADATGHGIGPALSATQLRAMLRVAVRVTSDIAAIGKMLNEQTHQDLPAGHFITTWLGFVDVKTHTLTSFSAGQAPLLHYRASEDEVRELAADTIPLGMMPVINHPPIEPFVMEPGDIFAVMSDGIYEAENAAQEQFETARTIEVLYRNRHRSAAEISVAIREAVEEFTGGLPANDDRTIVILKRIAESDPQP